MSEELLMQETQPEVNAETTDVETADADTEATREVAEDTTPSTEAEAKDEAQADDTKQEGEGETSAQANPEAEPESEPEPPVVRVKFNKQHREYTVEEAAPLVQKGLLFEKFEPHYEKLKFMASTTGQGVAELIDTLMESNENALYEKILDEVGGNEKVAKQLHEYQKAERKRKFDELVAQEVEREKQEAALEAEAENSRLAQEFIELKKEVGKFNEFKDVPDAVLSLAAKKKISLLDAYLRYERSETKKAEAAKAKQAEAAKSSTGSLSDSPADSDASMFAEISKGVWGE